MLAFGSSWSEWNKFTGAGTLAEMGRDEIEVKVDVEEGEISDSASVEEISEEDFNNQEVRILKESKPNGDSNSRVWTMRDLYNKYPSICRGYASGLYNLAWAQAVQNKPLNFGAEVEKDDSPKRSSPSASAASLNDKTVEMDSAKEVENVVIDDSGDEKEEGELEEGEIDMDFERVEAEEAEDEDIAEVSSGTGNVPTAEVDVSKQVSSIRGVLEGLTASEVEKSFEDVCSKLDNTLPNLRDLIVANEMAILTDPALIKLAFGAINCVFFYVDSRPDERNKGILSRLLSSISGYEPPLFSLGYKKEIERMCCSLDSSSRIRDKEKDKKIPDGVSREDSCSCSESMGKASISVEPVVHNKSNTLNTTAQPGMSGFRSRAALLPLLDLHKDHDADSLPSPTREMTPPFFARKSSYAGDSALKSPPAGNSAAHGTGGTKLDPYETDALKAVSTYQQKFGQGSMFLNELPSPTPSEESGGEDGDTGGDVSSSLIGVAKPCPAVTVQPIVSAPSQAGTTNFGMQGQLVVQNAPLTSSGAIAPAKSCAKSRDPRLRFAFADSGSFDASQSAIRNAPKPELVSGLLNSRKQKNIVEPPLDSPVLKKRKNDLETSKLRRDVPSISGSCGWLEGNDAVGTHITNRTQPMNNTEVHSSFVGSATPFTNTINGGPHMTSCGNEPAPVMTASTLTQLPALLKDIAVNPTMLLNLLKMSQQQKSAAETQPSSAESADSAACHPSSNPALGAAASVCFPPVNPGSLHKPAGSLQNSSQLLPPDDSGKIRMKPRDPRRILHGNMLQRNNNLGIDQFKSNGLPAQNARGSNDVVNAEKTEIQPPKHLQSPATPPNIARQFTKNLKNIAEILSVSQTPTATQAASANEISPTVHKEERNAVAVQTPEVGMSLPRTPNAWGDVDDLFEGYDDKQKAAIQRERARRIEEQKKMFASRKLCLVLDLDHTLLNSAKFHEVDPVHQDILRKKEEQDREKSQRHLFRFPHMGMWTKLRPGIWNFLEKASKLYELHLYTMGNKLYATEMAKVLDPKGVLFSGRVISRGDDGDLFDGDERVPKSKDLEGVLGMESAVVIIDDSVRVWPHNKLNLIVVERYTYFPCSRRQFGLLGPSLLEIDHDERPEDGSLASSLAVIEKLHKNFFSNQNLDEVDVRNILASEQRRILAGCRIVFSRVFPVGEANPHLHPLWQTAEQFGATCTNQIDDQVTHVVANSLGTDKVNWALSTGRFVVHPGWVEASALLYRRVNEVDFAIKS